MSLLSWWICHMHWKSAYRVPMLSWWTSHTQWRGMYRYHSCHGEQATYTVKEGIWMPLLTWWIDHIQRNGMLLLSWWSVHTQWRKVGAYCRCQFLWWICHRLWRRMQRYHGWQVTQSRRECEDVMVNMVKTHTGTRCMNVMVAMVRGPHELNEDVWVLLSFGWTSHTFWRIMCKCHWCHGEQATITGAGVHWWRCRVRCVTRSLEVNFFRNCAHCL